MRRSLICLLVCCHQSLSAELTDTQKLSIREAQLSIMTIQAEKSALESRLKDLAASLPAAQQHLSEVLKAATPEGYVIQQDLSLKEAPKEKK